MVKLLCLLDHKSTEDPSEDSDMTSLFILQGRHFFLEFQ